MFVQKGELKFRKEYDKQSICISCLQLRHKPTAVLVAWKDTVLSHSVCIRIMYVCAKEGLNNINTKKLLFCKIGNAEKCFL